MFWLHNDRARRAIRVVACGNTLTGVRISGTGGRYVTAGQLLAPRVCSDPCVDIKVHDRRVYRHCFDFDNDSEGEAEDY